MQNIDWPNIAGLLGSKGRVAILGAPMTKGSVTPSDYHKAPNVFRTALKRISTYDLEAGIDLVGMSVKDAGDVDIEHLLPKDGFKPTVDAFSPLCRTHDLSVLIGGHNGITRAGVHALDPTLKSVGVITLDAHFDLRPLDKGLMNGNPISALLADGLNGSQISQIGISPFANSAAMHQTAIKSGINVFTMADVRTHGLVKILNAELRRLAKTCDAIYIDFDIDVIERALSPGAPGGRAGGILPLEFFAATRAAAAHPKVRAVDLCEFDPSLDQSDITALISGRWMAELLCGFTQR